MATIATTLLSVGSSYAIMTIAVQHDVQQGTVQASRQDLDASVIKAPVAIIGDNVYVAWRTNDTANNNAEVMFRASADGGQTFGNKINFSNFTDANSQDVEIAADGDTVIITWWERNATSNEPVVRMSTDDGATFGPLLELAAKGTIGS